MNYDPVEYCRECDRVRPKDTMCWASVNKKRRVCSDCRERIEREREKAKQRAKEGKR